MKATFKLKTDGTHFSLKEKISTDIPTETMKTLIGLHAEFIDRVNQELKKVEPKGF